MEREFDLYSEKENGNISFEMYNKLRNRVSLAEENIVVLLEVKDPTPDTINIEFDKVDELVRGMSEYCYVINLNNSNRPDAKTRNAINKRFSNLAKELKHVAYCTEGNLFVRTAIRFVMYSTGITTYSIHTSQEEAIERCKAELGKLNVTVSA